MLMRTAMGPGPKVASQRCPLQLICLCRLHSFAPNVGAIRCESVVQQALHLLLHTYSCWDTSAQLHPQCIIMSRLFSMDRGQAACAPVATACKAAPKLVPVTGRSCITRNLALVMP